MLVVYYIRCYQLVRELFEDRNLGSLPQPQCLEQGLAQNRPWIKLNEQQVAYFTIREKRTHWPTLSNGAFFRSLPPVLTPNFFKLSQSCLCSNTRLIYQSHSHTQWFLSRNMKSISHQLLVRRAEPSSLLALGFHACWDLSSHWH